jgi:cytoskeletal protein CcmA (bactofilin family)
MSGWPFMVFAVLFAAVVCLHFYLAYRAWRGSREEQAADIDPEYVRMEDYFARSFRRKVAAWLALPARSAAPDGSRVIRKGRELIRVTSSAEYPPQSRLDDILVVQGAFRCLAGCVFSREIYTTADARIGAGTRLQSIAADGNLELENGVHVARWADCAGDMTLGAGSAVTARATAGKSILLHPGARAGSLFAPTVSTSTQPPQSPALPAAPQARKLEIPPPAGTGGAADYGREIDRSRLNRLSGECLLYDGDLKPSVPVLLRIAMVVKGDCLLAAGSVLEGDLKAEGRIFIGESSICRGNVVAGGDIRFGASCRFYGVVHAGKKLRLGRGVRGGGEGANVAAFAGEVLVVEEDVIVHGKLASADHVMVTSGAVR